MATLTRSILSRRRQFPLNPREDFIESVGRVEQHLDQRVERREVVVLEVLSVVVFPMLFGQLPRLDQFDVSLVELGAINGEIGDSHGGGPGVRGQAAGGGGAAGSSEADSISA